MKYVAILVSLKFFRKSMIFFKILFLSIFWKLFLASRFWFFIFQHIFLFFSLKIGSENCTWKVCWISLSFFSIWVFVHEDWQITGQQRKGDSISLTPHYHFHLLHRHLDISRAITAESVPLHMASSQTRTGNLCFPSASR